MSLNVQRCRWCGASFNNSEDRTEHENIHRQLDDLGHTCSPIILCETADNHHYSSQPRDEKDGFICDQCGKRFTRTDNLKRHVNTEHQTNCAASYSCAKCSKTFGRKHHMERHDKTCSNSEHVCPKCKKICKSTDGLKRHLQWHGKLPVKKTTPASSSTTNTTASTPASPQYRCRRCSGSFENRHDLYLHGMREHYDQSGGALQQHPYGPNDLPPWHDDDLRRVYEANAPIILENHRQGPVHSVFNFPLTNNISINQLMGYVNDIYQQQQRAFRLNLIFGVILQNRETRQYRYFVPYNNNGILERPFYISRRRDLQRFRLQLEQKDITTELLRNRPDTKWIPVLITNVHFTVYSTYYPLGHGDLPAYLLRKDSIYPLVKNRQNGKPYQDNLCAFRSLALHRGYDIKSVERPAKQFFRQWSQKPIDIFEGLSFEDFPEFETRFKVNMEVYSLQEDGFARSVYKSRGQHDSTMFLNLYENHLSYIKDFKMYAQKYQCKTCDRHFKKARDLHCHQKGCSNKTKYVYPGGFHKAQDTIFDQLSDFGIDVSENERFFPWFICYDLEAMLEKVHDQPTLCLEWTHKHVPISVSICTNVPGHTAPLCIVDSDQNRLVQRMVSTMNDIAERVFELAEDKWGWVLQAIDDKINADDNKTWEQDCGDTHCEEATEGEPERKPRHPLRKLYGRMEAYMCQVPVLGFNSAKYDLNLIKRCIAKHLNMHDDDESFVVKKDNSYTCIATDRLKFLDISQFLAAGSSYAGFLKAYHVEEQKGYFPYEWFDQVGKLEFTSLPSHEEFYSRLKEKNISAAEYQFCQRIWIESGMTTFRDFLVWYNNLDVMPFVEAVRRFQTFYFDKGIDVFKTAISVPGIARQLLFRTARAQNVTFALFDRQNCDLYQTIKQNIVGGPSIIFTRHHCSGKTLIRGQKRCGAILGFDANALYLQCVGREMPVGPFVRRRADNDFRPELRDKYMSAYYWMEWLRHTQGISIEHRLNTGREVRVGKYLVDGYSPAKNPDENPIVYQFHGCYWHGHLCYLTRNIKDEKWRARRGDKFKKTLEITTSLKRESHVVEMWECQFRHYCQKNPAIYDFIDSMRPGFFQNHKGKIDENKVLDGVIKGELFGMVEVDIEVPEQWPWYFQHPSMTPYEYFREMSPLFCTTEIPYDVIGEHMQQHVDKYNLSKAPRKLLVGGMRAKQILLATPLLQWYVNHGLVVTKIYQVVEFQAQRCFKEFVKNVSDARRSGDNDPDTAIIADTMKVIGNSAYGSLIMDKTKHRQIKYVKGENEASLEVNNPLFRKLDCLDQEDQFYEIEMAKRKIKLDLPIQLGYFILQYAKLRMLEFYFDFMDIYVDRSDFEYCEMDTDSAYMAISGSCLEEVIKPDMQEHYRQGLKGFCTDTEVEADAQHHWFPRTCCEKHSKYDKRTPGLFKLEYRGDELIGLCSKTYIVRKTKIVKPSSTLLTAFRLLNRAKGLKVRKFRRRTRTVHQHKFSSKGVSKTSLKTPMTKFRHVLKAGTPQSGRNCGFRVRQNTIFTYTQERRGFSYFYCKRKVLNDGIHTIPLDITLCPLPQGPEVNDQEVIDALVTLLEENDDNSV